MLKAIKETSVKMRRKFDQTFKREAVQNWLASGKSAQVIAKELGLLHIFRRAPTQNAIQSRKRLKLIMFTCG
jgi:transposase-like protein